MFHKFVFLLTLILGSLWLIEGFPFTDDDGGIVRGEFHYDKKIVSLQQEKVNSNVDQLSKRSHRRYDRYRILRNRSHATLDN